MIAAGLRRKPRLDQPGRGAMTHPSPGQSGSRRTINQRTRNHEDEHEAKPRSRPTSQCDRESA